MRKLFAACVLSLFAASVWAELPEGYTQVNYVKSSGAQYVKTGYVPNNTTKAEVTFSVVEYNDNSAIIFGSYGRTSGSGTKGQYGFAYGNPATCRCGGQSNPVDLDDSAIDHKLHTIAIQGTAFVLDGETIIGSPTPATTGVGTDGREMLIFAYGYAKESTTPVSPQGTKSSICLYAMKVWTGDVLALDLVPAVDANDVAGLYDLVNNQFLTSATTTPLEAATGGVEPPIFVDFETAGTKTEGITASVKVVSGEEANATIECYIGTDPATWEPYESWSHTTSESVYEAIDSEVGFGSYFVAFRATYDDGNGPSEIWTETNRLTFVDVKDHWLYDPLSGTVTDGMWKFAAEAENGNLSVGKWTDDGYPLDPSSLDFSKPVRDADQNVYVITNLNTQFGTDGGSWQTANPSEAGGRVAMLVMPESGLVSIGSGAFAGCSSVTNIVNFLPDSVQTLGAAAFYGINNSKCACDLVCNTTNVGTSVFKNSPAIKSVTFGPRTKNIGGGYHKEATFGGCTGITNIVFDAACENVKLTCSFDSCRVAELKLNGVTNVASRALDSCQFQSITFDRCLQFVSTNAFDNSKGGTARTTLREVRFLGPPPMDFYPEFYGTVAHSPADDNLVTTYVPNKYIAAWQEYATDGVINKTDSTFALEKLTITDDPSKRLLLCDGAASGIVILFK